MMKFSCASSKTFLTPMSWLRLLCVTIPIAGALLPHFKIGKLTGKLLQVSSSNVQTDLSSKTNNQLKSDRATNPISGAYDKQYWSKAFQSQPTQFQYNIDANDIEGIIPLSLSGTLFRSMPALFERGGVQYGHYLDGDGYVIRMTFHNGCAHFTSRFVETEEFVAEADANKILFRSTFRTQKPTNIDPTFQLFCLNNGFDLKLKNLANTNIIRWGKRLLTLFEAGLPQEIDATTLINQGNIDLGITALKPGLSFHLPALDEALPGIHSQLFGAYMTAHPKIDLVTNRLVSWIWRATPSLKAGSGPLDTDVLVDIYEWDENWSLVKPNKVSAPSSSNTDSSFIRHRFNNTSINPHDFSITSSSYVFVENRVTGNTFPYIRGLTTPAQCVDIDSSRPMILNIIPRRKGDSTDSTSESLQIPLVPGFTLHSVCAFTNTHEKGRKTGGGGVGDLELLTTGWDTRTVAAGRVKGGLLGAWEGTAPDFDQIPCTYLYRTVVDPRTGRLISHEPVAGMESVVVEHPHIHPGFESRPLRYVFMSVGSQTGISSPPLGYLRIDLHTGEKQVWYAPQNTYCEEVVIVPKEPKQAGHVFNETEEDDVWVLASMFDAEKDRSCVGVFDGRDIGRGPVCRVWLKHHLPHSLHGSFTSERFV